MVENRCNNENYYTAHSSPFVKVIRKRSANVSENQIKVDALRQLYL